MSSNKLPNEQLPSLLFYIIRVSKVFHQLQSFPTLTNDSNDDILVAGYTFDIGVTMKQYSSLFGTDCQVLLHIKQNNNHNYQKIFYQFCPHDIFAFDNFTIEAIICQPMVTLLYIGAISYYHLVNE